MLRPRLSPAALRGQSDDRLVALARAGDDGAFAAIDARYRKPLVRYCSRLVGADAAEDAVQQTFIQAVSTLRDDVRDLALRPWLYRVAHNTALKMRARSLTTVELEEGALASDAGIERVLERRDEMRDLVTRVRALPDRQREALVAVAVDGRAVDDVAGELDLSRSAVHQLLHRARVGLRERLGALVPLGVLRLLRLGGGGGAAADGPSAGLAAVPAGQLAVGLLAAGGLALGGTAVHHAHSAEPAPRPLAQTQRALAFRPAASAAQPTALGRAPGPGSAPPSAHPRRVAARAPAGRDTSAAAGAAPPAAQDAPASDPGSAPVEDTLPSEEAQTAPPGRLDGAADPATDTQPPPADDAMANPAPEPDPGAPNAPPVDDPSSAP
jgi:RNA polymerase sigma factor (sigma-70 family)